MSNSGFGVVRIHQIGRMKFLGWLFRMLIPMTVFPGMVREKLREKIMSAFQTNMYLRQSRTERRGQPGRNWDILSKRDKS